MAYRLSPEEEQQLASSPGRTKSSLRTAMSYHQCRQQNIEECSVNTNLTTRYEQSSVNNVGDDDEELSRSFVPGMLLPPKVAKVSLHHGSALLLPMSAQPPSSTSSLTAYVNSSVTNFFSFSGSHSDRSLPIQPQTTPSLPKSKSIRNFPQGSSEGIGLLRSSSSSNISLKQFVSAPKAKPKTTFVCVDEDLLYRAVKDAGRWALGCVMVETWVQIGDHIHLPLGGCWIDPVFHNCNHSARCEMCRLLNPLNPNYVSPAPLAPGEGLQGYMWSHSEEISSTTKKSFFRSAARTDTNHYLVWRDIKTIANDPHQPYNARLQALAQCGVGWAAAVPFEVDNHKGMVVYITRPNVDMEHLQGKNNESYLFCAAQLVGSAWALRSPRRRAKKDIRQTVDNAMRRVRIKILAYRRMGIDLSQLATAHTTTRPITLRAVSMTHGREDYDDVDPLFSISDYWQFSKEKAKVVAKKCLGQNVPPPPPISASETGFSCIGVFVSLTVLTTFNVFVVSTFGKRFEIPLGPFGALMGLQFCLTAAPAAQPLNAIVGQAIATSIGLITASLFFLQTWVRQALATTIAIGVMSSLGIVHPPASASAIIFASGGLSWTNAVSLMVANVIAVIIAALANNLNDRRQYPTTWGFRYFASVLGLYTKKKGEMSPHLRRKIRNWVGALPWSQPKKPPPQRSTRKDSFSSDYGSMNSMTSFSSIGDWERLSPV